MKRLVRKLAHLNRMIMERCEAKIAEGGAQVVRVFVMFDSEIGRRKCLKAMSIGACCAFWDVGARRTYIFKGNILRVRKATEPEDIQYENYDVGSGTVLMSTVFVTIAAWMVVGMMILVVLALYEREMTVTAAFFITCSNSALPKVMKVLNSFEIHYTRTAQEGSLLFKLFASRSMVSAFVLYIVSLEAWTQTLSEGSMRGVMWVLISDAFVSPFLRFADIEAMARKYILTPAQKSQEAMNMCCQGTQWHIAERYSGITKSLLICSGSFRSLNK